MMTDKPSFSASTSSLTQTAVQRVQVLHQAKAANPALVHNATPHSHRIYGLYLAGELTWEEACSLRDAPATR